MCDADEDGRWVLKGTKYMQCLHRHGQTNGDASDATSLLLKMQSRIRTGGECEEEDNDEETKRASKRVIYSYTVQV
jgi:hypothetical protein